MWHLRPYYSTQTQKTHTHKCLTSKKEAGTGELIINTLTPIVMCVNVPPILGTFSMYLLHIENRAHWRHIGEGGGVPNVL